TSHAGGAAIESHIGCKPLHKPAFSSSTSLGLGTYASSRSLVGICQMDLDTRNEQRRTNQSGILCACTANGYKFYLQNFFTTLLTAASCRGIIHVGHELKWRRC